MLFAVMLSAPATSNLVGAIKLPALPLWFLLSAASYHV
jgi:hypothetical protein